MVNTSSCRDGIFANPVFLRASHGICNHLKHVITKICNLQAFLTILHSNCDVADIKSISCKLKESKYQIWAKTSTVEKK